MNNVILKKYKLITQDVEDYILKKKRKRATRKQWESVERSTWELRKPKCPMCNQKYDLSNPITKEHIIPLILGGRERDCNIVALCQKCNRSRNNVMNKLLGTTEIAKIRARWPGIKPAVNYFIIWCHVSLNDDKDSLEQVKDLNEAFAIEREIEFPLNNKTQLLRMNNSSSLINYINVLFKNIFIKKKVEEVVETIAPKDEVKLSPKKTNKKISDYEQNINRYKDFILELVGDEKISIGTLGRKVISYQNENNWPVSGQKSLFMHYNIPEKLYNKEKEKCTKVNYHLTIDNYFSEELEITGNAPFCVEKINTNKGGSENSFSTDFKVIKEKEILSESLTKISTVKPDINGYRELIFGLIGDEKISGAALGKRVINYQIANNWEKTGKKALFSYYNIPRTINKRRNNYYFTIKTYFSENIKITIEPPFNWFEKISE